MSKGAPFWIWVKKFPDEPKVIPMWWPVSFSKRDAIAGRADCRSDAAATVRPCAAADPHASNRDTTVTKEQRTRGVHTLDTRFDARQAVLNDRF